MGFLNASHVISGSGLVSGSGFLLLGFLMGVTHAFEADHLAALGTLATRNRKQMILRGAAWGLGHTTTLLLLSAAVVLSSIVLTEAIAAALEFAVGVMLVLLGADALRQIRARKLHFHLHSHGEHGPHVHLHSHEGHGARHDHLADDHAHITGFPVRALLVGLVHGAAGSAAIIVLAAATAGSAWLALGYVALVGLGSILGMAGISALISLPIALAPANLGWLQTAARLTVAVIAMSFGLSIMAATGARAVGVF